MNGANEQAAVNTVANAVSCEGQEKGLHPILYDLFKTSTFCDVTLVDDAGHSIKAHSCVLAAGSPVIEKTLLLKQSSYLLKLYGLTVNVAGVSYEIWTIILEFLYLNQIYNVNIALMSDLFHAAKMLNIKGLDTLLRSKAESLGIQVDLSREVEAVNVNIGPSVRVSYRERSTQTDILAEVIKCSVSQEKSWDAKKIKENPCFKDSSVQVDNLDIISSRGISAEIIEPQEIMTKQKSKTDCCQMGEVHSFQRNSNPFVNGPVNTESKLRCKYCAMTFDRKSTLIDHVTEACFRNRGKQSWRESFGDSNQTTTNYQKRQKFENVFKQDQIVLDPTLYYCLNEECNESFDSHSLYLAHLGECIVNKVDPRLQLTEIDGKLQYCDGSDLTGTDAIEKPFAIATNSDSSLETYKCSHCGVLRSRYKMADHLATVHGKRKLYCCKKCDAAYGYFASFRDHFVSEHTTQIFKCDKPGCNAVFTKKGTLSNHILRDHKREGRSIYPCKGCGKMFKYAHHARRHAKYHLNKNDRNFICSVCAKRFVTKQDLARHFDLHTGRKPYKCTQCDYSSTQKTSIVLHERKHGLTHGDYVCTTCMKYFVSETRFQKHLSSCRHEGCHVSKLPSLYQVEGNTPLNERHEVIAYNTANTDSVQYQQGLAGMSASVSLETTIANPATFQVLPFDGQLGQGIIEQTIEGLEPGNMVCVVASGEDYVYDVETTATVPENF